MGISESRGQLARSLKDLLGQWAEAKTQWQDAMSAGFEKTYLDPLELDARNAASALDHIAAILHQARSECE